MRNLQVSQADKLRPVERNKTDIIATRQVHVAALGESLTINGPGLEPAPMPANSATLEIRGVTRRFGKNTAVSDINIAIPQGQMVGIIAVRAPANQPSFA